jgi:hypothetical protein
VAGLIAVVLAPLRAAGDKLVWSKVRCGLGGKVREYLQTTTTTTMTT